ncbi:MAG: 50S ribosomal protein L21 [Patescibacteria group bacterium]
MFAIVAIGGKQYKVSPGETVAVEKIAAKVGDKIVFDKVLLLSAGNVRVGRPFLPGIKVTALVLSQEKGEKIQVARFKSKVRYRRLRGFRPQITKLEILAIGEA